MSDIVTNYDNFSTPVCNNCKHYRPEADGFTCSAFPDGIPEEILLGINDHSEPMQGQTGSHVYEPIIAE